MKTTIISFAEIMGHPTTMLSAEYWVNIKSGKLPFRRDEEGSYVACAAKELTNPMIPFGKKSAIVYLTREEAQTLTIATKELMKAKAVVDKLLKGK